MEGYTVWLRKTQWLDNFVWKTIVYTTEVCLFDNGEGRNYLKRETCENKMIKKCGWTRLIFRAIVSAHYAF